ncbi:GspH/FimT family pseudopilin [Fontimonas sp. SYSU GA230001]|uniref:GspH/FimT family pseudopilin n=1 Tax=Fontimonas sp. SYSU GA230001 TaxID=3142450 RepID=UPI0032B57B64
MVATKGFTLIELLIVLAIGAVLTGVAVPSVTGMLRQHRLTAAHNELLTSLYLLRSEAAKRNRIVKMCRISNPRAPQCDTSAGRGWDAGWAIWVDTDNDNRIGAGETLVSVHPAFGHGLRLTGNGSLVNRIAYLPTGAPSGFNNGTFTVCTRGRADKRQIVLSSAGRIRTQRASGVCP